MNLIISCLKSTTMQKTYSLLFYTGEMFLFVFVFVLIIKNNEESNKKP